MAAYRMTPARRAALKKAQIASARKRRGTGKAKVSSTRRRKGIKTKSSGRRRAIKAATAGALVIGAGAYTYKNRENLVIKHMAVYRAVKDARRNAKNLGYTLTPADYQYIKQEEKMNHANRSTFRVREYREGRAIARSSYARGKSLRPDRKNNAWSAGISVTKVPKAHERYMFEAYRKDVFSRAVARHARMKGKKRRFNYDSGKRLTVSARGKVKREFW